MRRKAFASVVMLVACHPRPATFSAQDETAVRAVADSAVRYQLAGDWPAWAALFSEDGVLQPPNTAAVKGRPALLAWAKTLPPVETAAFTNVQVWGDGNLSYGTSGYTFTLQGLPPDTGKQLWVSRRAPSGKWEVVAVSFNSDLAMPGQQGRNRSPGKQPK
jgi:ketosteroid isomerase-like protein